MSFLIVLTLFTGALIYTQFFAYYERDRVSESITIGDLSFAVEDLDMIDASTSPLKLRACFRADPESFAALPIAPKPTPLNPPPWFSCFDAEQLSRDLTNGRSKAYLLAEDDPDGTDTVLAIYSNGEGYLWRQLDERFSN